MVNSVTITNYLGESLELELRHPEKSGIAVLGIEGLDPPPAQVNLTQLATGDGGSFNSVRALPRNIVMYLKPYRGVSVEHGRRTIYKYLPLKSQVKLRIETDGRIVETVGRVENNDVNIFSNNQIAQISIICPFPYLTAPSEKISVISGIIDLFEFPFGDETEFEFARYKKDKGTNIIYEGDARTGVIIKLHAEGDVVNPVIYNSATRQIIKLDTDLLTTLTGQPIIAGDSITISTVRGNKYASLVRAGQEINIMNILQRPVQWIELVKGDNVFAYDAETGESDIVMQIEYIVLYEGV